MARAALGTTIDAAGVVHGDRLHREHTGEEQQARQAEHDQRSVLP
jgi:hypothetical protein